jgi:hypothetical protein
MSLDVTLYYPALDNGRPEQEMYSANITHNLTKMADAAGIYRILWRPEEVWEDVRPLAYMMDKEPTAEFLIPYLQEAVRDLLARPDFYKQFNASNGWGVYEDFLSFVTLYLSACSLNRNANVRVSR